MHHYFWKDGCGGRRFLFFFFFVGVLTLPSEFGSSQNSKDSHKRSAKYFKPLVSFVIIFYALTSLFPSLFFIGFQLPDANLQMKNHINTVCVLLLLITLSSYLSHQFGNNNVTRGGVVIQFGYGQSEDIIVISLFQRYLKFYGQDLLCHTINLVVKCRL